VALEADASSWDVALSEDGSIVAFHSFATSMVPGDTNGLTDVFVRTRHPDPFEYCTSAITSAGCQPRAAAKGFPSASSETSFTVHGFGGSPSSKRSQVGRRVNAQYWGRDPQGGGSFFTTAVEYVVGP
jgi:hypothetical protein